MRNDRGVNLLFCLGLGMVLSIAGCGKNSLGPTAPTGSSSFLQTPASSGADIFQAEGEETQFEISCHTGADHPACGEMQRISNQLLHRWFTRFTGTNPFERLWTANPVFTKIMRHFQIDQYLLKKSARIIGQVWSPSPAVNPGNFSPKVTLFPKDWNPREGFNGNLHDGWMGHANHGFVYSLGTHDPDGKLTGPLYNANRDLVQISTFTFPDDMYAGQASIQKFVWNLGYSTASEEGYINYLDVDYFPADQSTHLSWTLFEGNEPNAKVNFMVFNQSHQAMYHVQSGDNTLILDLRFNTDGSGGGTLDRLNKQGSMDHYDFTVYPNGHGFWLKNNTKKHTF